MWDGPPGNACAPGPAGCVEARVRVGWLADSEFGRDRVWHARGGVRWSHRRGWLGLEAEGGDVERYALEAGLPLAAGWDLAVERRFDDQSFARDRRAWLVEGRYPF